jgi:AcrR family transcriptional regulator
MRQTIIDAAVALFNDLGYRNTGMHHIVGRAKVTKEAFYRHFPNKESVAIAIIAEADARIQDVVVGAMSAPASALENLIVATLVLTDMTERESLVRVANLLRLALNQVSAAPEIFYTPLPSFLETAIRAAIVDGDLIDDIDVDAVAHTVRAGVLGSRLLSDATADAVYGRMAQVWRVILRGNVPPEKWPYLEDFVTRIVQQY